MSCCLPLAVRPLPLPRAAAAGRGSSGLSIQSPLALAAFPSPLPLTRFGSPSLAPRWAFHEGPSPSADGLGNVTRLPARLPGSPLSQSLPFLSPQRLGTLDDNLPVRSAPPSFPFFPSHTVAVCHQAAAATAKTAANESARNCRQPGMSLPSPPLRGRRRRRRRRPRCGMRQQATVATEGREGRARA